MVVVCLTQQKTYCMSYLDMYRVYECLYAAYQSVPRQSRNRRFLSCTQLGARSIQMHHILHQVRVLVIMPPAVISYSYGTSNGRNLGSHLHDFVLNH
jgi:hypothetical protein